MMSPIEQVSRDITEGRVLSFSRCLCLTRPSVMRVVFVHLVATLNRAGMNGVPSRHSFFIFISFS
jgi:hypothetical protein